jgi:SpoVK/Ycf46/Vps4 family AAA+-type ATPase
MGKKGDGKKKAPALLTRLRQHFGREPAALPVIGQHFEAYQRPNLHLALQEVLGGEGMHADLVGVTTLERYDSANLARLAAERSARNFDEGPVEYASVDLPDDKQLACVKQGLYLARSHGQPLAVLVSEERYTFRPHLIVEVMANERERAERLIHRLTQATRHGTAYRGHVLSLDQDCHGIVEVKFHHLPAVRREDVILPEELMRRLERHTLSFTLHAERLREAGRHLKRGILLHGPPGTGKTLSAMYLVSQMPGRTVLLLTGKGVGQIETACNLARMLEPATVILEDVDLIGTQRHLQTVDANALLIELLNQMDGLADDVDLLFLLTSNRPDILEPALAARPGRIDQAIQIPLPDADCRRRLFELYSRGMQVEVTDWPGLIERTEGATGAFIRELLRKAAVFAAEEDGEGPLTVHDKHLDEALTELLVAGGPLTQSLLGAGGVSAKKAPTPRKPAPRHKR